MSFNIVLDPGHGQYGNPGAIKGFYEGTNNYEACLLLKAEFEKYDGVTVKLTRGSIVDNPGTDARGKMGQNADLFLSWHSNGFIKESAKGVSSFYSQYIPEDKALCKRISDAIVPVFGSPTYDRGQNIRIEEDYPKRDYYGVIRNSVLTNGNAWAATPVRSACKHSIIVEHGFHSNVRECGILMDSVKFKAIIQAEAKAIAEHFGLKIKSEDDGTRYRVQVGSFRNKTYADTMLQKLKSAGFDGYITKVKI